MVCRLPRLVGIGGLLASLDTLENTTASDDRTFAYFYDGNGNVTQLLETTGGTAGGSFGTLAARYEYDRYQSVATVPR